MMVKDLATIEKRAKKLYYNLSYFLKVAREDPVLMMLCYEHARADMFSNRTIGALFIDAVSRLGMSHCGGQGGKHGWRNMFSWYRSCN